MGVGSREVTPPSLLNAARWLSLVPIETFQTEERVKSTIWAWINATVLIATPVTPVQLVAQAQRNKFRERAPNISVSDDNRGVVDDDRGDYDRAIKITAGRCG
jgi:hypothetical protein